MVILPIDIGTTFSDPERDPLAMWFRVGLVALLALPWIAPAGAAGAPTDLFSADSATLESVVITAGDGDATAIRAGAPAIDFAHNGAGGLAPGMTVVLGDPDRPAADHAFAVTNDGDAPVQVALHYRYDHAPPAAAGVALAAYDEHGTPMAGASGAEAPAFTLAPGETGYIVVTVSTRGATPADDLSGTLEFTVVAPG